MYIQILQYIYIYITIDIIICIYAYVCMYVCMYVCIYIYSPFGFRSARSAIARVRLWDANDYTAKLRCSVGTWLGWLGVWGCTSSMGMSGS